MKLTASSLFLLVMVALAIGGCDPSRFVLQGFNKTYCRTLSPYGTVESHESYFDLYAKGCVRMSVPEYAEHSIELWIDLVKGNGVKLLLRSRTEETVLDSGYVLTLSDHGVRIDSGGTEIASSINSELPKAKPTQLTIYNDEKYLQVTLGCDTIFRRMTPTKAPDQIVFASIDTSVARIYAVDWRDLDFLSK